MSSDLVRHTRAAERRKEPVADKLYAEEGTSFALALADRVGVDRFIRAAVTSFKTTPKLAKCDWDTVTGALYVAAQMGLEIGGPRGLAYLVPYGTKASLVLGYKGWVDLMYRAGARSVQWFLIREGDHFRIGSDAVHGMVYEWHPLDLDDSRPVTGAVAQVMLANGGIVWDYMTDAQILARRPEKWKGTPWETWPDEMRLKTVLKHLAKRVPMSTEVALAAVSDDTVQRRVRGVEQQQVQHVPVAGLPAPEQPERRPAEQPAEQERPKPQEPRQRPQQRPDGPDGPAAAPAPRQGPPQAVPDEEETYLRQSDEAYAAWLESQGPM